MRAAGGRSHGSPCPRPGGAADRPGFGGEAAGRISGPGAQGIAGLRSGSGTASSAVISARSRKVVTRRWKASDQ